MRAMAPGPALALVVVVVVVVAGGPLGSACYVPELDGLRCDDDHPCLAGNACLRGICVEVGAGSCASDADCPDSACTLTVCDGDDCGGCPGWTGTCDDADGAAEGEGEGGNEGEGEEGEGEGGNEGEGEEGEGEGEGEGPNDPCALLDDGDADVVRGDLTIDNPATLSVLAGKRGVDGTLRIALGAGVDLAALASLRGINGDLVVDGPLDVDLPGLSCVAGSLRVDGARRLALTGLDALPGDVIITGTTVADLAGLRGVVVIGGDLRVIDAGLASLSGLEGLVSIGGRLQFVGAPSGGPDVGEGVGDGRSFAGLSALRSVGSLLLDGDAPADVSGLAALVRVTGALEVDGGDVVELTLPALERVGSFVVAGAPALRDLSGLGALTVVDDELVIDDAPLLAGYQGLGALTSVGELRLGPAGPPSLSGLEALRTIDGALSVENSALVDLIALDGVTAIGTLAVVDNDALVAIDGLVAGRDRTVIAGNPLLARVALDGVGDRVDVSGCPALVTLIVELAADGAGDLLLADLPALVDGSGLTGARSVRGDVTVTRTGLRSLDRLTALREIGGDLRVVDNAGFDVALPGLVAVGGALVIERAPASSLDGLRALIGVGGALTVVGAGATDLTGLAALQRIGGALSIEDNGALTSVDALNDVDGAQRVSIRNNPVLSSCDAERLAISLGKDVNDVVENDGPGCFCGVSP